MIESIRFVFCSLFSKVWLTNVWVCFRCMVEAGYNYSTDCLPDPAVWEQMLNMSPIKHVKQVCVLSSGLCFTFCLFTDPMQVKKSLLSLPLFFCALCLCVDCNNVCDCCRHSGEDSCVADSGRG